MKKLVAAALIGTAGLVLAVGTSYGQGTLNLNNYDSGFGIYQGATGSTAAPAGTFIQVLAGATAGSMTAVFNVQTTPTSTFTVGAGDVNGNGPNSGSYFDFGYGHVPSVAPGATAFIQVISWETASSYANAVSQGNYVGASAVFTETLGTNPAPPGTPVPAVLALPAIIRLTIPEPSTIALGGLSAAALLLFRRRK